MPARLLTLLFVLSLFLVSGAGLTQVARADPAEGGYRYLGHGRIVNNDFYGDGHDRWRTGSVIGSRIYGRGWEGRLPTQPGDIIEIRLGGEIIAPRQLSGRTAGDRPYAAALSLGLHTHFRLGEWDTALGADVVVTGPQNGLTDLQNWIHDGLGVRKASPAVLAGQVPDGVHAAAVWEMGRNFVAGSATLRPFVEVRAGPEDILRAGFDVSVGPAGQGELLVRDPVTGQRFRAIRRAADGWSFVAGADVARVMDSLYLPDAIRRDVRYRVRSGVHWQNKRWTGFYGLTLMGPEFVGQSEAQLLGSLRIQIAF
ncbi:lipid A-modifier LpxR family protein [Pseudooceanicola sp. C21-150M6]|uniref:lipid A-modifier LpxR family protein n=1 Tax=Pseudooceanicola sp. C21-150M6 TaxID=3434355 RepID=UPI003D7FF9B7